MPMVDMLLCMHACTCLFLVLFTLTHTLANAHKRTHTQQKTNALATNCCCWPRRTAQQTESTLPFVSVCVCTLYTLVCRVSLHAPYATRTKHEDERRRRRELQFRVCATRPTNCTQLTARCDCASLNSRTLRSGDKALSALAAEVSGANFMGLY